MTEPAPTYNVQVTAAPAAPPSPVDAMLNLVAELPAGLAVNGLELEHPDEPFIFINFNSILFRRFLTRPQSYTLLHRHLRLLLDLAAAAKAAEPQVQAMKIALSEIQRHNPLRNDRDAYLFHLIEWALGDSDIRPNPADFGITD